MENRRIAVNIGNGKACVPPRPNIILPKNINGNGNNFFGISNERSAYEMIPHRLASDCKLNNKKRKHYSIRIEAGRGQSGGIIMQNLLRWNVNEANLTHQYHNSSHHLSNAEGQK